MPEPNVTNIVVAGDIVIDYHIYQGERLKPGMLERRAVEIVPTSGGAAQLCDLLAQLLMLDSQTESHEDCPSTPIRHVHLGTVPPGTNDYSGPNLAFAIWKPVPRLVDKPAGDKVWRATELMGYGAVSQPGASRPPFVPVATDRLPPADILVLDDGGDRFRRVSHRTAWLLPEHGATLPRWILLKLSGPICQGDLWHELTDRFADRLICLVSADDLRRENIGINTGLSWERTVGDLRHELNSTPAIAGLLKCRHLVVAFSADGVLWLERAEERYHATLSYDDRRAEGDWAARGEGDVVGLQTAMAAALARALAMASGRPNLTLAAEAGLSAMRNLHEFGHGQVGVDRAAGYPTARIAAELHQPAHAFARTVLPWDDLAETRQAFSIVYDSQRPLGSKKPPHLLGLARQVVLKGRAALNGLPHAAFGKLVTADRLELEALRHLRRLMVSYQRDLGATKPLAIGVFGPPGAGKSFGVREIAHELFGKESWLEFNLSQFERPSDLFGAFHQARDLALSGKVPVVFWDEFDSREHEWLQHLLAPLQDGRFQEDQLNHALGRGVFIFAGGTSFSYASFNPDPNDRAATQRFRLRKGPDFKSRLDTFYDVLGPNQRRLVPNSMNSQEQLDPSDFGFCLRRGLLIRGFLVGNSDETLDIDPDLLDALLLAPDYTYGARSLDKLLQPLRPKDGLVRRSALLPTLVAMHTQESAFNALLNRNVNFRMRDIERLAAEIHNGWLALPDRNRSQKPHLDKPYADLGPAEKEDNRAAAKRIPEILALAGLGLEQSDDPGAAEPDIVAHIEHHLVRLAEAEHDGWVAHKRRNGWRYSATRDDAAREHDALVPYAKLDDEDKAKDQDNVRSIVRRAAAAGYRVAWLPP